MVTFYKPVKKEVVRKAVKVTCSDLDLKGRGVATLNDRIYFVDGLMMGDTANVLPESEKGKIVTARVTKLITPSAQRREKDCALIGSCGGCPMQHVPAKLLLESKIMGIRRLFKKTLSSDLGEPDFVHQGDEKGYRRACRFAIRGDHNRLYLGFREEKSHKLCKVFECLTLTDRMNHAIEPLNKLINSLTAKDKLGHIELLDSDGALGILMRFTASLNADDEEKIRECSESLEAVTSIVEPYKDPLYITKIETTRERVVAGDENNLFITSHGVKIKCKPSSFVQINRQINERMLDTVISMLSSASKLKVLDLFCGLGNFTMPLAYDCDSVVGVDIVSKMIEDARNNAAKLSLSNARFEVADLEELFENQSWAKDTYDAVVMDPGREGARRATLFLCKKKVAKIVYISCNPLAASRDTVELIKAGYRISKWGVCDMFPRTTHVEMILEFEL